MRFWKNKKPYRTWVDTFQKGIQSTSRYLKKHSTALIIKELQIKTTVRDHLAPDRVSFHWKDESPGKNVEKGTLGALWKKCKMVQALWKTAWRRLRKLKLLLLYDLAILLPIYLKEIKSAKPYLHSSGHHSIIHNSQLSKNEWVGWSWNELGWRYSTEGTVLA